MSNQPESNGFDIAQLKKSTKIYKYFAYVFMFAVAGLIVILFLLIKPADNSKEKDFEKAIKTLSIQLDSLKSDRIKWDEEAEIINGEIERLDIEKMEIYKRIEEYRKQLSNIKKSYEKIPDYAGISNDSLRRIFTERFDQ